MNVSKILKKIVILPLFLMAFVIGPAHAQKTNTSKSKKQLSFPSPQNLIIKYGVASYYAAKFHGRKTASGETYRNELATAACNVLPLNTWVRITNLTNNVSIVAKINDRLHPKNKRLIDLSKSAAHQLGYISDGLTKVKVEVLEDYNQGEGITFTD
ncbi:MAG: septal ring lytic transglycosylase RlpA family protein [Ginsengibacter sp.]